MINTIESQKDPCMMVVIKINIELEIKLSTPLANERDDHETLAYS